MGEIKRLPTKATIVKDRQGAYVRGQHVNPHEKNVNSKSSKHKEGYDFTDDDINDVKKISEGITEGTLVADTTKGRFFVKPVEGEKFSDGYYNVRKAVTLNEKSTGRALSPKEVYKVQHTEGIRENYTGSQADREVMATRLADELGFDHIPHAEMKSLVGEDGVVMRDVHELYKGKFKKILTSSGAGEHYDNWNV
jgi:hypothetical protein